MDRYNFRQQTRRRHFWGPDEDDEDLVQEHSFRDGPMAGAGYDMDLQYVRQLRIDQIEEHAFRQVLQQFQRFPIETLCRSDVYGVIEMAVREELMKHDINYENDYTIRFSVMAIPINVIESGMQKPKKVSKNEDIQQLEEEEDESNMNSMHLIDWSAFQTEDEPSQIEVEMDQDTADIEDTELVANPYEHIFKSYINVNPFVMQEEYDGSAMGGGRGLSS